MAVQNDPTAAGNAQRRPGAYPRRHPPCTPDTPCRSPARSTKAGSLSPATRPRLRGAVLPVARSTKAGSLSPATLAHGVDASAEGRRSTKAGSLSPATRVCVVDVQQGWLSRSTKAGSLSPATPHLAALTTSHLPGAQRRPGAYPRRHPSWAVASSPPKRRSTKAGSLSPATPVAVPAALVAPSRAQRRPGAYPRRHLAIDAAALSLHGAQRRPGAYPRRHSANSDAEESRQGRSTKAGSLSPATQDGWLSCHVWLMGRSTKAGSLSPATPIKSPLASSPSSPLNEGRELIPGDTSVRGRVRWSPRPLNEGRELIPGDTSVRPNAERWCRSAQRRPGAYPRRHLANSRRQGCAGSALNEGRELIPGDTCTSELKVETIKRAQRRPGAYPRRHRPLLRVIPIGQMRSTKAGSLSPATRGRPSSSPACRCPLNEGRELIPGDT